MIDVEPLIVSELDRLLPLSDGSRSDWADVVARAGYGSRHRARAATEPAAARRRPRPLLVAAIAAVALLVTATAVAAGLGAFDGIGAADHAQTPQDVLDPVTAAQIERFNADAKRAATSGVPEDAILPDSARRVGQLPTGEAVYVVSTSTDKLCVVIEQSVISCGAPLSQAQPVTLTTTDADGPGGAPAINYGIARDGITALSFRADGSEQTVPVTDNVWAYEGDANLRSVTVHYTDGSTQTLNDGVQK